MLYLVKTYYCDKVDKEGKAILVICVYRAF